MKQLYDNLMAEDSEVNKEEWNLSVIHLKQVSSKSLYNNRFIYSTRILFL